MEQRGETPARGSSSATSSTSAGWIRRRPRRQETDPPVVHVDKPPLAPDWVVDSAQEVDPRPSDAVSIEDIVAEAVAACKGDDTASAHACALTSRQRLARLDGIAESLRAAADDHRRFRGQHPGGVFSKAKHRKARLTKANDFVRDRTYIAYALAKHYNEVFHPRGKRFAVGQAASALQGTPTATRGHHVRAALFWLDTLMRFDSTFNEDGDLPAPTLDRPVSSRESAVLYDDPMIASAALADKFEPPGARARERSRPAPKPRGPVDFRSGSAIVDDVDDNGDGGRDGDETQCPD